MLWSLIKILAFVAAVGALAMGAGYLMEADGQVLIAFGGFEIALGPLTAAIAVLALLLAAWLALRLAGLLMAVIHFLNGDETALSRYFDRNRERRGYKALSEALTALAAGDARTALVKAARAERALRRPELTDVIIAQAAEAVGDRERARQVYKRLALDEGTRFLGLRGLMKLALAKGDTETALQLAMKAAELNPRHEETAEALLRLQLDLKDWDGARRTLDRMLKAGLVPRDVHRRRQAVLLTAKAQELLADGHEDEAFRAASEASRLAPGLVPAVVLAARGHLARGEKRAAARLLQAAWATSPHPELAAAFAEIEPEEPPAARRKRFARLIGKNRDHPESRLLEAELAIADEDFPAARRAIASMVEDDPDARVLTLMAAIERGEGAPDHVVEGWLARAVAAPRGPQWVCERCHAAFGEWHAVCPSCGALDTLSWTRPRDIPGLGAAGTGIELLPLTIRPPHEEADAAPESEEEAEAVEEAEVVEVPEGDESDKADTTDPAEAENEAARGARSVS